VEAQAKQVVKEATWVAKGKGKRSQKRKSNTLKAKEDTAKEDTTRSARRGRKRKSAMLNVLVLANKKAQISNAPKSASTLMR
jgi:hypothetical protein